MDQRTNLKDKLLYIAVAMLPGIGSILLWSNLLRCNSPAFARRNAEAVQIIRINSDFVSARLLIKDANDRGDSIEDAAKRWCALQREEGMQASVKLIERKGIRPARILHVEAIPDRRGPGFIYFSVPEKCGNGEACPFVACGVLKIGPRRDEQIGVMFYSSHDPGKVYYRRADSEEAARKLAVETFTNMDLFEPFVPPKMVWTHVYILSEGGSGAYALKER